MKISNFYGFFVFEVQKNKAHKKNRNRICVKILFYIFCKKTYITIKPKHSSLLSESKKILKNMAIGISYKPHSFKDTIVR